MKSKCTRSSMPSFLSCSTTVPRLERRISGYVLSCISFWYAFSVGGVVSVRVCYNMVKPSLTCV